MDPRLGSGAPEHLEPSGLIFPCNRARPKAASSTVPHQGFCLTPPHPTLESSSSRPLALSRCPLRWFLL